MKRLLIFVILILGIFGCYNSDPDLTLNNVKIKKEIEERRQAYQKKKLKECKANIIASATAYVDSILSARISYQLSDSIFFPPKPEKPISGNPVIIQDTSKAMHIKR